jgi:hypothetical protein
MTEPTGDESILGAGATGPAGQTGPAEGQTGAEQTGAAQTGAEGQTGPQGQTGPAAPEKYELKLPEGSNLQQAHLDEVAAIAKQRGLSNEDAQAMVDRESKLLDTYAEGQQKNFEEVTSKWGAESKSDPEIFGGSDENFQKNSELAKRVIDRYGTPELKQGLNSTGFGNHPALVKFVLNIGKAMSEDQLVIQSTKGSAEDKSMEEVFYGDNKEKKE